MGNYSMPRYFQNMPTVGKPVRANAENVAELRAIEDDIHAHVVEGLNNGKADEAMNAKGQLTAMQRIALLVDPGTWCPLNSLYNPEHNKTGTTSIVKGLGRVNGKWCCIIASDTKKHAALAQIEATKGLRADPPGSVSVHYGVTGFFREVYTEQEGVIAGIKKYVDMLPTYDLEFFRVDEPQSPAASDVELYDLVLNNKNRPYDMYSVIARLFDGSQFMEYKKGYGPEMITGIAKVDGLLVGVVANQQGVFPNYPEYKMEKYGQSMGAGGKLYRQGLIKMNEFVTLCARDRLPMIWIQDTTGIDVGDDAEVAELLGLGQSLIYSIQNSKLPMMEITLRRGTAAAHYVLGGPQGNDNNAFSLGTAATEINVMNGKTAANAIYTGRLAKDQKAGKDLQPTIDKMNALIDDYDVKSKPLYCAQSGLVDEIVDMPMMRNYIVAFTDSCYQNPESICPFHQMLLPRTIKDYDSLKK